MGPFLSAGGARGKLATQRDALQGVTDIVIGTPGRLGHLFDAGLLKLDCCQAIVLDEVDVVLGEASQYREEVHHDSIAKLVSQGPFSLSWKN